MQETVVCETNTSCYSLIIEQYINNYSDSVIGKSIKMSKVTTNHQLTGTRCLKPEECLVDEVFM